MRLADFYADLAREYLDAVARANTDLTVLHRAIARRWLGLSNLCRLPFGRHTLRQNSGRVTLRGDASTSETPKAI